ncbi:hypothetical protein HanPSC8_Chr11g0487561 [Helianthus annuus]|nr:hypothetical protein HanPSC8_Chr11g0487561 [Helianthus annuus]
MGAFYMDNKPILNELKLIEKFAFLWKIALVNFLHKMSKGKSCFFVNSKEIVDLCSCSLGFKGNLAIYQSLYWSDQELDDSNLRTKNQEVSIS